MINLVDATNPTKRTSIFVYALHLVELTGRASAMLIVHSAGKPSPHRTPVNRTQAQSNHITSAFEHYQHHTPGVAVQPLTILSPHSTMYKDVCKQTTPGTLNCSLVVEMFYQANDARPFNSTPAMVALSLSDPCRTPPSLVASLVRHHLHHLWFEAADEGQSLIDLAIPVASQELAQLILSQHNPATRRW